MHLFTLKTNFLHREQGVQSHPGWRYVHVVSLLIFPHFILFLFQSLAQGYDTGTAPEVPMAAKYTPVGGNVNTLWHPPPTSISTVTVRPHYSKSTPLMLSCTVYLHICSDSLHLISGVDHPWNMDRQLRRMYTRLYPIYRLLCSVCNLVPLLLSSGYSKYNPHTKILELIWLIYYWLWKQYSICLNMFIHISFLQHR